MSGLSGFQERKGKKMNKRELMHQKAIHRQDAMFKHNAHIRQKIYAGLFTVFVILFWAWLMSYGCVYVWYGFLAVPFALYGTWLMVTDHNYVWDALTQERREENG